MISEAFVVNDPSELLALQRVFREAKFCIEPDDLEISDSPIVSRMFQRLMDALIASEVEREGEHARQRWMQWLVIDESRDEWQAAIRRARAEDRWSKFSRDERISYVRLLLSPFTVSADAIDHFIHTVNQPC